MKRISSIFSPFKNLEKYNGRGAGTKQEYIENKIKWFLFKHFRKSDLKTFQSKATEVTDNISNYTTFATITSSATRTTTAATTTNNNKNKVHTMLIN